MFWRTYPQPPFTPFLLFVLDTHFAFLAQVTSVPRLSIPYIRGKFSSNLSFLFSFFFPPLISCPSLSPLLFPFYLSNFSLWATASFSCAPTYASPSINTKCTPTHYHLSRLHLSLQEQPALLWTLLPTLSMEGFGHVCTCLPVRSQHYLAVPLWLMKLFFFLIRSMMVSWL